MVFDVIEEGWLCFGRVEEVLCNVGVVVVYVEECVYDVIVDIGVG